MLVEEIKDNELLRQFETKTACGLLTIEYAIQERKIFLTKLCASENEQEDKVNQFITSVLDIAQERKFKVVPTNTKIVSFFRKNKKFHQLLPPGIKI
jgi:hypothetical protein